MSKVITEFNKNTSYYWEDDPAYNNLFIQSRIAYFQKVIQSDGVIVLKEVFKAFGFRTSEYSTNILTRYWNDGNIDITYSDIGDKQYEIIFKTDN